MEEKSKHKQITFVACHYCLPVISSQAVYKAIAIVWCGVNRVTEGAPLDYPTT